MTAKKTEFFDPIVIDLTKRQMKQIADHIGKWPTKSSDGTVVGQIFYDGGMRVVRLTEAQIKKWQRSIGHQYTRIGGSRGRLVRS